MQGRLTAQSHKGDCEDDESVLYRNRAGGCMGLYSCVTSSSWTPKISASSFIYLSFLKKTEECGVLSWKTLSKKADTIILIIKQSDI